MFSPLRDFSPAERQRLDAFLDQTYAASRTHVAAGRHLTRTRRSRRSQRAACGRARTPRRTGLVDELGGYAVALRLAREAAKLSPDAPIKLVTFPHPKSTAEILFDRLLERERDSDAAPSGVVGCRLDGSRGAEFSPRAAIGRPLGGARSIADAAARRDTLIARHLRPAASPTHFHKTVARRRPARWIAPGRLSRH